ncbi:efflux RND transporter periplasmic adaptor subunit [Fuerstiella marisgermanici]|uniref:Macrolide-specific efflux protein MacA n=1 Tax=Fuerstiella marisgermanici TaxID=1891926 RepID=A0A1P8W9J1_9PLAN|nr:efflux RND transporter periplasmic adaptor subunit [Fuerstiella marisgermanici]APZ90701.1 Macrolide-specific efflux protein MacA precursor [Fuerstiella marisgermanici]
MNEQWNTIRVWLKRIVKFTFVTLIAAGVIYWIKFSPVSVDTYSAERGTIVAEVMGTGTLEARVSTTVSPKISGRIVDIVVDQGSQVSRGKLLVRLDDEELQQQVAIAQANVDAASAAIVRVMTDKNRAAAVYDQAKKSHDRIQGLVRQNAASPDDEDKAVEALAVAEAGASRAEAAIAEAQKELVAAEKTLEYHRARLHDTQILAPFDGLVVKRSREPGDVVVPGSSILTLISTDELWIRAWVDETEMARLQTEQSARVVFRSEPDKSYPGTVARLGREADRETREFIVDVRVLELPSNWAVGQRAEAFVQITQKDDALLLPARLIVKRNEMQGVFVDEDGIAVWRPISIGLRRRDTVEVLEGLSPGDSVVTPKKSTTLLSDGRRVTTP